MKVLLVYRVRKSKKWVIDLDTSEGLILSEGDRKVVDQVNGCPKY